MKYVMLKKMWNKVQIDEDQFRLEYEDWLEDEVWTYFD